MDYTDYEQYPKTLPRDDFWGQIRRTIYGRRISEEELAVIVTAIKAGLKLSPDDELLDLMCGNGALTARLYDSCGGVLGVDLSSYLIDVAKEYFEQPPTRLFVVNDVLSYVRDAPEPSRFTKALCYGSLHHLSGEDVRTMLRDIRSRFRRVERLYLGNLPDKNRAHLFFGDRLEQEHPDLTDPKAQTGVWWTQGDLHDVAAECGWRASFVELPADVFNAHYRFDALLEPDR